MYNVLMSTKQNFDFNEDSNIDSDCNIKTIDHVVKQCNVR